MNLLLIASPISVNYDALRRQGYFTIVLGTHSQQEQE
jgi:hypothetical protein